MLRKLELSDAKSMLDWMHDSETIKYLDKDFSDMSLKDCQDFVTKALSSDDDLHMAICDNKFNYCGTVSLKNIDGNKAEFAIVVAKKARGTGMAIEAMHEIISIGFEKIKLDCIYWYVSKHNKRAIKFYNKNGYKITNEINSGGYKRKGISGTKSKTKSSRPVVLRLGLFYNGGAI